MVKSITNHHFSVRQVIISVIWYRLYRCSGTADSRCWIFRSGRVVPLKQSFFDIMTQQRA